MKCIQKNAINSISSLHGRFFVTQFCFLQEIQAVDNALKKNMLGHGVSDVQFLPSVYVSEVFFAIICFKASGFPSAVVNR